MNCKLIRHKTFLLSGFELVDLWSLENIFELIVFELCFESIAIVQKKVYFAEKLLFARVEAVLSVKKLNNTAIRVTHSQVILNF